MKIERIAAVQAHPVPSHAMQPRGPFPPELFRESPIVFDYESAYDEGGDNFEKGATVQNNFKPAKFLRCGECLARVKENETETHVCE